MISKKHFDDVARDLDVNLTSGLTTEEAKALYPSLRYYHFTYNRFTPILSAEQAEQCFESKVLKNKRENDKYTHGVRFKMNGVYKVKMTCRLCGEIFVYPLYTENGKKQRPNYCEKCLRREKTWEKLILKNAYKIR